MNSRKLSLPDNLREPKALAEQLRFLASWLYPEKQHCYATRDMAAAICVEAADQIEAALAQQAQPGQRGACGHVMLEDGFCSLNCKPQQAQPLTDEMIAHAAREFYRVPSDNERRQGFFQGMKAARDRMAQQAQCPHGASWDCYCPKCEREGIEPSALAQQVQPVANDDCAVIDSEGVKRCITCLSPLDTYSK